ncbi:uncharacterized protein LOC114532897 [Dendronephthya gigantea]|uniref:uncharacterized protein LOC114532897 n=1 Tax=Dendronephthya gigantea TaxID=151771 RepID=UPI00106A0673|nr:uncharacterized protein LOC114532897 [Dendronephthya gigantea]
MDISNGSSSENSLSSGSEDSRDEFQVEDHEGIIQPYAFEPVEETDSESDNMAIDDESSQSGSGNVTSRLADIDKDWCLCSNCQIMDREEECVCCQEVSACVGKNEEVAQFENTPIPACITDNSGF